MTDGCSTSISPSQGMFSLLSLPSHDLVFVLCLSFVCVLVFSCPFLLCSCLFLYFSCLFLSCSCLLLSFSCLFLFVLSFLVFLAFPYLFLSFLGALGFRRVRKSRASAASGVDPPRVGGTPPTDPKTDHRQTTRENTTFSFNM